jgi:hypothetical protein
VESCGKLDEPGTCDGIRPETGVVGGYVLKTRAGQETRIPIFHLHYCAFSYAHCLSIRYESEAYSFN